MFELAWPWIWLLLPLPWLLRARLARVQDSSVLLRVPFLEDFLRADGAGAHGVGSSRLTALLLLLGWLALLGAASRPLWQGEPVNLPLKGRDLMLAVDLSGSMEERDFVLNNSRINRLQAVKVVAGQFIDQRQGDRVGLILFGDRAYQQAPLTFDRKTVKTLLDEAQINMAGKRTAIGDAIGLAVKRLAEVEGERVLILLSDGRNTAGEMEPLKAAELAQQAGLKIYTIGVGAEGEDSFFGMSLGGSDLDERTLNQVATQTGGRYFRARDTRELAQIYGEIDKLEPVQTESRQYRPKAELFYWPLAAALGALMLVLVVRRP